VTVELTVVWFHVRLFYQTQLNDKLQLMSSIRNVNVTYQYTALGMTTRLGLDDSVARRFQTSSGANPVFRSVVNGASFSGDKATGA